MFLGWNRAKGARPASYTLTLPQGAAGGWRLEKSSSIELSLAALDEDAPLPGHANDEKSKAADDGKERQSPEFTIELETSDGVTAGAPVSRFAAIPPPLKERFTKLDPIEKAAYEKDWEPVLQTVRAPLAQFTTRRKQTVRPGQTERRTVKIRPYRDERDLHQRDWFWTGGLMRTFAIALLMAAAALPAGLPEGVAHLTAPSCAASPRRWVPR